MFLTYYCYVRTAIISKLKCHAVKALYLFFLYSPVTVHKFRSVAFMGLHHSASRNNENELSITSYVAVVKKKEKKNASQR